jgi:hypothetical protein
MRAQEVGRATSATELNDDLQLFLGALQKTVDETVACKKGQKLSLQLESMRIPEYESWFPATFGAENGARLAGLYSESSRKEENRLVEYFLAHGELGGRVEAVLTSGGPDPQRTEFQRGT